MPITKDNAHLYLPYVQALMEGKTIQYLNCHGGRYEWETRDRLTFSSPPDRYRIKPGQDAPAKQLLDGVQIGDRLKLRNGMIVIVEGFKDNGRLVMASGEWNKPHPWRRDGRSLHGKAETSKDRESPPEFDAIAVLPAKPTIRPWTPEEVPVGCIARNVGTDDYFTIQCPQYWCYQYAVNNREYSPEPAGTPYGKRTWMPCGVVS